MKTAGSIILAALLVAVAQPLVLGQTPVKPSMVLKVSEAHLRTRADVLQSKAFGGVNNPAPEIPFRPTMGDAEYQRAKASTAAAARVGRNGAGPAVVSAAPALVMGGEGVDRVTAGNFFPPDTHGAAGLNQFVEITNTHIDVYELEDLATLDLSAFLNDFFGYTQTPLFDPRVVYDSTLNRWVITAEAFAESPDVQLYFIAISQTADASGPYFIYSINMNLLGDDFWDYPQLGMDQNSVIFTGNVFGPAAFRGARTFAVAKSLLYNGLSFSVPIFTDLCGTLAPPIVLDDNPNSYLMCAQPVGTTVLKYTMQHSSEPDQISLTVSSIPVSAYSLPRSADQPNTDAKLDTLDARFVNASTQTGTSLWQVHTIQFPTNQAPTPKFYEFNTSTDTVKQSGFFFADTFSDDFNASIVADRSNARMFVTWSSTNSLQGTNAEVRFGGCKPAANCVIDTSIGPETTSGTFWLLGRWGDYSAITVDPNDPDGAFLVNEYVIGPTVWGSRIVHIHY